VGKKARDQSRKRGRKAVGRKFGQQSLVPHSVEGLGDVEGDDEGLTEVAKRRRPDVGEVGEQVTSRSCLSETVLVVRKKSVRF